MKLTKIKNVFLKKLLYNFFQVLIFIYKLDLFYLGHYENSRSPKDPNYLFFFKARGGNNTYIPCGNFSYFNDQFTTNWLLKAIILANDWGGEGGLISISSSITAAAPSSPSIS